MLPANKLSNLKRRVARARRFPDNTCAASRHVEHIAHALLRNDDAVAAWGAEHCAGSLLSVLESLWKARTELARLKGSAHKTTPRRISCASRSSSAATLRRAHSFV